MKSFYVRCVQLPYECFRTLAERSAATASQPAAARAPRRIQHLMPRAAICWDPRGGQVCDSLTSNLSNLEDRKGLVSQSWQRGGPCGKTPEGVRYDSARCWQPAEISCKLRFASLRRARQAQPFPVLSCKALLSCPQRSVCSGQSPRWGSSAVGQRGGPSSGVRRHILEDRFRLTTTRH